MRAQLAMQRLGLEVGAEYTGKCNHPFFRPYDLTFQLGKVMRARPRRVHLFDNRYKGSHTQRVLDGVRAASAASCVSMQV